MRPDPGTPIVGGNTAERAVYIAVAALTLVYVLVRAARVPLVHDECASVLWFVQPGQWLPHQAHSDANNHFLSSGIGVLMSRILGPSMLALRIGSALAFVLYAWASWRLGAQVRDRVMRWCFWSALLLCPFVVDFFALFRGYAIELAGWTLALDGLLRYADTRRTGHLGQALLGMLTATAAIVALLPVWAIVIALLWGVRARQVGRQRMVQPLMLLVLAIIPLLYTSRIALGMQGSGLLYHGSTDGFFRITVSSLCRYVLGSPSVLVGAMVVLLLVLSTGVAVRTLFRPRNFASPLIIVHVILWSDVSLRIVLARGMGVNFPEDRAGIHFVPLVLACMVFALDRAVISDARWRWSALLLFFLPARMLCMANTDHTALWPEQSVPPGFYARVAALQRGSARPLVVAGHHQLALTWPMNARVRGGEVPSLQTVGFPLGEHELRIVDRRFLAEASFGFHALDSADGPGLWLLERDRPLEAVPIDKLVAQARTGNDEFLELAHLSDSALRSAARLLEVNVPLSWPEAQPDVRLVIEVNDRDGSKLYYDAVAPSVHRPIWNGERLVVMRSLPVMPNAFRAVIYLYNPGKADLAHGEAHIQMYAFRP